MKVVEKDDGTYLEFSNLEEAEEGIYNALVLLKKAIDTHKLPISLEDEIVDFISNHGFPEETKYDTIAMPNNEEIKMKCKHCDLVVEKIPKWKEGECPSGELQHEFRVIKGSDN